MVDSLIEIRRIRNNCFIWKAKDARVLREDFRIVGTLVGALPRAPRQNSHLGLPLQLMPEEVTLLIEKGVAVVVDDEYGEPTEKDIEAQREARHKNYKAQVELFKKERREEIRRNLPQIIEGKKAKKRKLLEQAGETIDEAALDKEVVMDPDSVDIPDIKEDFYLVQLPLELQPRESTTCLTVDWSYPQTPAEHLRYKVFRDFWEKGHYLTSGSKFGGDFLVYPGDPARYHSFYIAVCLDHDGPVSALDVITMGRLATNVKKTMVLCSCEADGKIQHTSLQWTGIS